MSNSMVTAGRNARQSGNHPITIRKCRSLPRPLNLSGRDRRSIGYTQRFNRTTARSTGEMRSHEIMRLRPTPHKTAVTFVAFLAVAGWLASAGIARTGIQSKAAPARADERSEAPRFSNAGKAALSRQLSNAVSRGDTPGVVALIVGRDGVLYEGAAGKLDVAHDIAMPCKCHFRNRVDDQANHIGSDHDPVRRGQAQARRSRLEISPRLRQPARSSRTSTKRTQPTKRARRSAR